MSHFLNYFFIVSRYIFNVHLLINQLTMKKKLKRCVINISYSRFKVQLVEIAVLILHICIVGFLWSFGWLVNSLVNLMEAYQSFVTDLQQKTTDLFFYKKTADLFFYNVSPLTMCRHFKNQRKLQIQYFNVCIKACATLLPTPILYRKTKKKLWEENKIIYLFCKKTFIFYVSLLSLSDEK